MANETSQERFARISATLQEARDNLEALGLDECFRVVWLGGNARVILQDRKSRKVAPIE